MTGTESGMNEVAVVLPGALQQLAGCDSRISLAVATPVTQRRIIRALEQRYPSLCGAIYDHATDQRRPLIRFFGGREDLSHLDADAALPASIAEGRDEFIIVGAIAGG